MNNNIFCYVLLCMLLVGCKNSSKEESQEPIAIEPPTLTEEEIVRQKVEEFIFPKMHDPQSYEFVSIEKIDSTTYLENIQEDRNGKRLFIGLGLNNEKQYRKAISLIDSIEQNYGEGLQDIASYTFSFKFRANNSLGGKVLSERLVQTSPKPNYNILYVVDKVSQLNLVPNGYKGYEKVNSMVFD